MTLFRKFAAVGIAAVAALMLMSFVASTASAQAALPFKAFGSGLKAGQTVEAFKGTTSVGKTTVDAGGNWQIDIQPTSAANGDVIAFRLDGLTCTQTITFQSGQFTPPPGLALTGCVAATTPPVAPPPAKTGNAGLAEATPGTSVALMLLLGLAATGLAVGARAATRQR
jgi:hypothetical protein